MITPNSKIIFFGVPEISANILESLLNEGYDISLVVTNKDKSIGRKHIVTPSPVKALATSKNISIIQLDKITEESVEEIKAFKADLGIVVAYGYIIPQSLIESFPKGMLNIHYSLLPKWRGASPVQHSILSGDSLTGVTIQKLVFKLDAGGIIAVQEFPIDNKITSVEMKDELTSIGSKLLIETLPKYLNKEIIPLEQKDADATYCKKIKKEDGEIKLSDPDILKWRKYRAYFDWPGIFYFDENNKRIKITEATFENNKFVIKKIVPEGKNEITI